MRLYRARAHLDAPVVQSAPIHLDGLLSWAVVNERGFRSRDDMVSPHELWLPALKLHAYPCGRESWIWACSADIWPEDQRPYRSTFIKRADGDTLRDKPWYRSYGAGRDHMIKQATKLSPWVDWVAYGHPEKAERLLAGYVNHIGADSNRGMGLVRSWEIMDEPGLALDAVSWDGIARRCIPAVLAVEPEVVEMRTCRPEYRIRERSELAIVPGERVEIAPEVLKTWMRQIEDPTRRAKTRRQNRRRRARLSGDGIKSA